MDDFLVSGNINTNVKAIKYKYIVLKKQNMEKLQGCH